MPSIARVTFSLVSLLVAAAGSAQQATPFTVQDLVSLRRLSDPEISPDGHRVAFVLRETDLEANKGRTDLWLVDLDAPAGAARRLTQDPANDSSPRWSPDGSTLYFLSTRSGSSQVWRIALAGGEPLQVTDYPLDVGTFKVSPTGARLALTMEVFPECADLACSKTQLESKEKSKATGRVYDRMFVRHWDTWSNGTRSHLFAAALAEGKAASPVDLSRTLDADVPSKPFGGDEEFAFSPDGRRIVFAARAAGREESWSTNFDLYEGRRGRLGQAGKSHGQQPGVGHATGFSEERRSRLSRHGATGVRVRPVSNHAARCALGRRSRRRQGLGPLRGAPFGYG